MRAERISSIPIEKGAGLGIYRCFGSTKRRVHSALDELEVTGFHGLDQLFASLFDRALGRDV